MRPLSKRSFAYLGAFLLLLSLLIGLGWWWTAKNQADQKPVRVEPTACALPAQEASAPHPGMVWVPGGEYTPGDTTYPEERPGGKVRVKGFWMDRTEVTNDEFAAFIKATGYVTVAERPVNQILHPGLPADMQQPGAVVFVIPKNVNGKENIAQWWQYLPGANWRHPGGPATSIEGHGAFPVVTITPEDAQAYAKWRGHSMPSEAQWEWAARAAQDKAVDEHEQPDQANTWQGLFPIVNSAKDGFVGLAPVGCYTPNALGLFDMIGNVWEFTTDAWSDNHPTASAVHPDQLPTNFRAAASDRQVIKGGSFLCSPDYCMRYRAGSRQPQEVDLGASHLGFRTILVAKGP